MKSVKEWISKAFNLPILKQNRYNWVDYLRGVVILLVVYHHTYLGIQRSGIKVPVSIADANMIFYSFRMPLFFIVSGIFTSLSLGAKPVKDLVWVKFDKLLYPYFIWAFLQVTLQIFLSGYTNSNRGPQDYLYILYQPKQIDQFWYLPALFNATMVFIFIKTKVKPKTEIHILIGLVLYFTAPFLTDISMMSNWMRFYLFFVIGDILSHYIFKKPVQFQLKKPRLFLLLLPLFIGAQIFYLKNNIGAIAMENTVYLFNGHYVLHALNEVNLLVTSLIGCTTLMVLSFLMERWNKISFLRVIGFHSLYIYITHIIVLGLVRFVLTRIFYIDNFIIILITGIILGVLIPVMFYNLIGKNYLWFLFSSRKKNSRKAVSQTRKPVEALPAKRNAVSSNFSNT